MLINLLACMRSVCKKKRTVFLIAPFVHFSLYMKKWWFVQRDSLEMVKGGREEGEGRGRVGGRRMECDTTTETHSWIGVESPDSGGPVSQCDLAAPPLTCSRVWRLWGTPSPEWGQHRVHGGCGSAETACPSWSWPLDTTKQNSHPIIPT